MKILYLAIFSDFETQIGVYKKILGQVKGLQANGMIVKCFILYNHKSEWPIDKTESVEIIKYDYSRLTRFKDLKSLWLKITTITDLYNPDYIYFRYPGSSYQLLKYVTRFKFKVIFEHNTRELEEIRKTKSLFIIRKIHEIFFQKKIYRSVFCCVGASRDFVNHQWEKTGYQIFSTTISNGFDVQSVKKKKSISFNGSQLNILLTANLNLWHGIDRILNGLNHYYGKTDIFLYILGDKNKISELLDKYNFNNNPHIKIINNGYKVRDDLDILFDNCHLAIGSLGLHRLNIEYGVPIKHREYISRGIPFIYSGKDEDLPSGNAIENVLINVEPLDNEINIQNIIDALVKIYNNNLNLEESIRLFAKNNLDYSIKMRLLIDFIYNLQEKTHKH